MQLFKKSLEEALSYSINFFYSKLTLPFESKPLFTVRVALGVGLLIWNLTILNNIWNEGLKVSIFFVFMATCAALIVDVAFALVFLARNHFDQTDFLDLVVNLIIYLVEVVTCFVGIGVLYSSDVSVGMKSFLWVMLACLSLTAIIFFIYKLNGKAPQSRRIETSVETDV